MEVEADYKQLEAVKKIMEQETKQAI